MLKPANPVTYYPAAAPQVTVQSMQETRDSLRPRSEVFHLAAEASLTAANNYNEKNDTQLFPYLQRLSAATVLQGKRTSQQDVALTCELKLMQPVHWSPGHCGQLLANVLYQLGLEVHENNPYSTNSQEQTLAHRYYINSGSTACVAMIHGDRVFVGNVGDSYAFLVLPQNDHQFTCQRLNHLHDLTNPDEIIRIDALKKNGETAPSVERLKKIGLMVTRTLGNTNIWPAVSFMPEVTMVTVDLTKHPEAFVLTMSDGCDVIPEFELPGLITDFYRKHQHLPQAARMEALTKFIAETAFLRGSTDNITVNGCFIRPISQSLDAASHMTLCMTADGHGMKGDEIANFIKRRLTPITQYQIQQFEKAPGLNLKPITAAEVKSYLCPPTPPMTPSDDVPDPSASPRASDSGSQSLDNAPVPHAPLDIRISTSQPPMRNNSMPFFVSNVKRKHDALTAVKQQIEAEQTTAIVATIGTLFARRTTSVDAIVLPSNLKQPRVESPGL